LTVEYDDPTGAADALLAVLRPVIRRAELADEATEDPDDEETAA
jgi:hypothetical protein